MTPMERDLMHDEADKCRAAGLDEQERRIMAELTRKAAEIKRLEQRPLWEEIEQLRARGFKLEEAIKRALKILNTCCNAEKYGWTGYAYRLSVLRDRAEDVLDKALGHPVYGQLVVRPEHEAWARENGLL